MMMVWAESWRLVAWPEQADLPTARQGHGQDCHSIGECYFRCGPSTIMSPRDGVAQHGQ